MVDFNKVPRVSFYRAIAECTTEKELEDLLHDLLSESERMKITDRWDIAQYKLSTNCSMNSLKLRNGFGYSQGLLERVFLDLDPEENPIKDAGYRSVFRKIFGLPKDEENPMRRESEIDS